MMKDVGEIIYDIMDAKKDAIAVCCGSKDFNQILSAQGKIELCDVLIERLTEDEENVGIPVAARRK